MKQFFLLVFLIFISLISAKAGDSIDVEKLKSKITDLQSKVNEVKPKAEEMKNLYSGYQSNTAKKCDVALKEIADALDMAETALKDCEEVNKLAEKVQKAKKPADIKKLVELAEKKYKNAKYLAHQSEDRKKEVEFEMKGCH